MVCMGLVCMGLVCMGLVCVSLGGAGRPSQFVENTHHAAWNSNTPQNVIPSTFHMGAAGP
jgi:hypothetical protein